MFSFIFAVKYRDVNLHFCLFRYFKRKKNSNERKEEDEKTILSSIITCTNRQCAPVMCYNIQSRHASLHSIQTTNVKNTFFFL